MIEFVWERRYTGGYTPVRERLPCRGDTGGRLTMARRAMRARRWPSSSVVYPEEMLLDEKGRLVNPRFGDYHIFTADEMPEMVVRFVQTYELTHPFGVKAVAEIPLDGVGPAVANAVYNAIGVQIPVIPLTPERVWHALQQASTQVR